MDRYAHVIQHVLSAPLAIQTEMAAMIQMLLVMRRQGHRFSAEEIQARIGAGPSARQTASSANIAVIPVIGCIMHRMELMSDISSSGTSPDMLARAFRSAVADPNVSAIVLDIDSPGGTVFGLMELGDEIRAARGKKPVVAVANGIAASAAYWIGSQAEEFVVTPSGQVGSIGVVSMHENLSKMLENEGIEVTLIHSSKYKVEGNPFGPLDAEARESIKADVDAYDALFVRAVAKGRGVSVDKVRSEFGMGRMVMANDAAARGMVDGVETFDQVIARLMKPKRAAVTGAAAAEALPPVPVAEVAPVAEVVAEPSTRSADYYRSRVAIAQRKGAEHGVTA
jgi:capsid assembly protease